MANRAVSNIRFQLKNDTETNWRKASHFSPLQGELIIYSADETHPFCRLKVGDGITNVNDLPFIDAQSIGGNIIEINTTAYWNSKLTYVPNLGDVIIYSDKSVNSSGINIPGVKIGDGHTYCPMLPFLNDDLINVLDSHISDDVVHITAQEREYWNDKTLLHKLTFGAGETYVFDGSQDVTVPVYLGTVI